MKKIKLTPRLAAVASYVNNSTVSADIGTDHGYIPAYLIQNSMCKRAFASDINKGPLNSAMNTACEYNISDRIDFVCAPGLDGIEAGSVDTVIIAGMGGETIVGILDAAPWLKEYNTHVILQPQSKLELLEEFLINNSYKVNEAKLVKDAGRLYIVLSVCYSEITEKMSKTYFTDVLADDVLLHEYLSGIIKQLTLRKNGLESANSCNLDELDKIIGDLDFLNKTLNGGKTDGNS